MKLRNKIILSILLVSMVIGATIFAILVPKSKSNVYSAYIDINPLIKLDFKVSCKDDKCDAPVVVSYEFMNDDAKEIYKDLVIKDKLLKETIDLLANTVKSKDIPFKEVRIYSNYDNEADFKVENVDYSISFEIKEDEELSKFIDDLLTERKNFVTKDVFISLTYPKSIHDEGKQIKNFTLLDHQDLLVEREKIYKFKEGYEKVRADFCIGFENGLYCSNIQVNSEMAYKGKYIKATISGPKEILEKIPEEVPIEDYKSVYTTYELNNTDIGSHNITINIVSDFPEIEVLTPSFKAQIEIEDMPPNPTSELINVPSGKRLISYEQDALGNKKTAITLDTETNELIFNTITEDGKLEPFYTRDFLIANGITDFNFEESDKWVKNTQ